MYQLILASGSPRRKEILEQCNISFDVRVSDTEETINSTKPEEVVKELALQKAQDVHKNYGKDNTIILGADTVVAFEDEILGKPKDEKDAYRMINMLQNKSHSVYTGVALIVQNENSSKILNFAVETKVDVMAMSREQIESYLSTNEYKDKAGAYGIQGNFALYVEGIRGDYYNVVGLPIHAIYDALLQEGIDLKKVSK